MKIIRPETPNIKAPEVRQSRAVWRPNNAKAVLLTCGHKELDWPFVKALGNFSAAGMVDGVYCGKCADFHPIDHYMTPAEIAGIEILPMPEQPPF